MASVLLRYKPRKQHRDEDPEPLAWTCPQCHTPNRQKYVYPSAAEQGLSREMSMAMGLGEGQVYGEAPSVVTCRNCKTVFPTIQGSG
jgi:hypothetical protein